MATTGAQAKSGLRELKPGEILFNDSEPADSLFIIQKGQIRLFKPKGKGFIEIGVLRDNINDYKFEDFRVFNYQSYDSLKMTMRK